MWYPIADECRIAAESEDARRALAAFWFEQGKTQVDREAFGEAQRSFACSQAILPHPSTLYNLARAAEWAGDLDSALRALREYLDSNPAAENRSETERLAADIAGQIELRDHSPPPPPPPPPVERPVDAQRVAGWVMVGLAAAGAATGATMAGLAGYEQQQVDDAPDGVPWSTIAGREADRDDYLLGMGICLGIAGAAALTGILLLVLDEDEVPPVDIVPDVSPGGVGLAVVGRF